MAEVLPLENHHDSQMLDEVIIRPRTEQNNHLTMSYEEALNTLNEKLKKSKYIWFC